MMSEQLLVHDPDRITREAAIARSKTLAIGQVVHGLAPWMVQRGMDYGPDGYLVVVTCGVPEHAARREVLATFQGAAIRKSSIAMVSDHPPDPPSAREQAKLDIRAVVEKPDATVDDLKQALGKFLEIQ